MHRDDIAAHEDMMERADRDHQRDRELEAIRRWNAKQKQPLTSTRELIRILVVVAVVVAGYLLCKN